MYTSQGPSISRCPAAAGAATIETHRLGPQPLIRRYLERTASKISGWDRKPTTRRTTFMMNTGFKGAPVARIGGRWRFTAPLSFAFRGRGLPGTESQVGAAAGRAAQRPRPARFRGRRQDAGPTTAGGAPAEAQRHGRKAGLQARTGSSEPRWAPRDPALDLRPRRSRRAGRRRRS